ncbi:MAG: hypothetical protein QOF14_5837 [Hyphomicrobiales bacterium]|nr:hypothetical protein [Hyphomicrobiales bacterium]
MHREDGIVFGDLCLFSPGEMQALLELSKDDDHVPLDEIMSAWSIAEKRAPDGTEYLHAITYWAAIGDHFYQIQHASLQSKAMEEYLTWLLGDQTKVIKKNHYVELQAEFDRVQIGEDLGDVKSIEIGGLVPETVHEESGQAVATTKIVDVEARESIGERLAQTFQAAKKILIDLLGEVEAQKIIDSMPPQAALEVTVNIAYRAKKRKFQKEFMGNLVSGLRNIPDGEIRVRGRDGELKGDDARLSADMNIKRVRSNSSLLDLGDALRQIKEVHRRFLYDGRIKE